VWHAPRLFVALRAFFVNVDFIEIYPSTGGDAQKYGEVPRLTVLCCKSLRSSALKILPQP